MNEPKLKLDEAAREQLARQGQLIEAGWRSVDSTLLPADAPSFQREEMRKAFYMGAAHLFDTLLKIITGEGDLTAEDMQRMAAIDSELRAFVLEAASSHRAGRC